MKAFILDRYGKGAALRPGNVPDPEPGDTDVLVRIHAAGLNVLDLKIRTGEFRPILPYRPPYIPGHDLAGTVVRVGAGVRRFKPGDEVYARVRDGRIGTLAEYIAADEADMALKPANLTMEAASGIPLVALTVWQALVEVGKLQKGQKVLIQAGSGGVGTIAIQLAKHLGATVATTCSARNADLVRDLGADVVIDYKARDFEKELSGYDLVLHSQDSETLEKSLRILRPGGLLVSLSGPPDPDFAKALGLNVVLRLILMLLSLRTRNAARRLGVRYAFLFMRADGAQLGEITKLIEADAIRPVIDRIFPFAEANEALGFLDTGRARGKVVVRVI